MIIQGTTPVVEVKLGFDSDLLSEAYVTFTQGDKVVVEKSLQECTVDKRKLSVRLTQEETLLLMCDCKTEAQVKAKTTTGEVVASKIYTFSPKRILNTEVI